MGLSDKEGRVRERANESPKINDRAARNCLTLCVYALWQVPNVETVCGLNYHCQTSIKQHEWMLREGKPGVYLCDCQPLLGVPRRRNGHMSQSHIEKNKALVLEAFDT